MTIMEAPDQPAYHELIHLLSERTPQRNGGQLIAITSANRGEGVSYVVASLAAQLSYQSLTSVGIVSTGRLAEYSGGPQSLADYFIKQDGRYIFQNPAQPEISVRSTSNAWHGDRDFRSRCMQELRQRFSYVLFDCPPPRDSRDVFSLAPLVDGFVLVVEANKTKKEHIKNLERVIEFANGQVAGYVLNKRDYVIPRWLYSKF
jgi:Mrp family chromosome partitioning ATPase